MAPIVEERVLFNSIPEGYPEPGKTVVFDESQKIDIKTIHLDGGFLVKTLYLSIDPYMRGRMRPEEEESYAPAFKVGKPIDNYGVGVVVRSESSEAKEGDHVYGFMEFQSFNAYKKLSDAGLIVIDNKYNLPWELFVGAVGMPGKTAYMGWKEHSHAKRGETVFVSGGAGPVGSFVIQLAKMQGLKVIASAGSEDKVKFMESVGADVAFNYKSADTKEMLKQHGPINIYWDNVGGPTLDAALDNAKIKSRFIECGTISGYNEKVPVFNIDKVFSQSISMNGFIVYRLHDKYESQFYEEAPELVASGKIKHREQVFEGLKSAGEAILAVQKGTNLAKAVLKVGEE